METNQKKNSFEDAASAGTVQIMRRSEVEGELNFITDVEKLNKKLESENIVARFPDPEGGDPIDFEMKPMTPGQFSVYYNTLLGHTYLETAAGNPNLDMELDDEQQQPNLDMELDDEQQQKLQDELAVKKYDQKLLNILETNIISHPMLTAEDLRGWHPYYVICLHNALLQGSRPSKDVARFPDMDAATGE